VRGRSGLILGAVIGVMLVLGGAAAATSATSATTRPAGATVSVLETSADLARRLSRMPDLTFRRGVPKGLWVIHVKDSVRYQRVTGVGGGMTDSAAWLIGTKLDPAVRDSLMNNLFGRTGDHLSFLRLPMGASDFTAGQRPYSYDDLPAGRTDPRLAHFSVAHDDRYIVPAVRQALRLNPRAEVLATPWSAPPWMKANHAADNIGFKGTLLPNAYRPFAEYFVKFIQAYARRGIPIDAITPQNEPGAPVNWPGMDLPERAEAKLIVNDLRPAFAAARLRTKIFGADTGFSNPAYADGLATGRARHAIGGIAEHCYHGTPKVFDELNRLNPALDLVVSECAEELTPWSVPEIVIGSLRNWASAVALWNLALDPSGGPVQPPDLGCLPCRGLVVIDPSTHTVQYSLAFYQLGQVGRWLQPGARRIDTEHFVDYFERSPHHFGTTSGLDDVAFVNPDGSRMLVAYNNSTHSVRFAVAWRRRSFIYRLAPGSTASFLWR
jgi:glucosylceramidase